MSCVSLPCCDGGSYYLYSLTNGPLYGNPLVPIPGGKITIDPLPGGGPGMLMTLSTSCCDGLGSTVEIQIPKSSFSQTITLLCCNGATSARVVTPTMTASQVQALGLAMAIECTMSNDCPPGDDGPGGPFPVKLECCDGSSEVATATPGMTSDEINALALALVAACAAKEVNCGVPPVDPPLPAPGNPHPNPSVYYPGLKVGNDDQTYTLCDDGQGLSAPDGLPSWAFILENTVGVIANQFFAVPQSNLPSHMAAAKEIANAQALAFITAYAIQAFADGSLVCSSPCDGEPVPALMDFSAADSTFMAAVVPDIDTASAVVLFGSFGWAEYRVEYAGNGAFQIDVIPPGPGPEDEWLTNANPGGGFTTLFEFQYQNGLSISQINLPVRAPTLTEPSAVALMTGGFSSTVQHLPVNVGSATTPSTTKPLGIKTKTAPYLILDTTDPTWNLVRKRKLAVALPEGLQIVDFASVSPGLVGVDGADTDTTSAIWDGTLPGFNTGGLGPPMTFFEYRALYSGSGTMRLFNKAIGIFTTCRHFEDTFPTATGCAFVLAIGYSKVFNSDQLAWAGYKYTGAVDSMVGMYCFATDVPGYTIAGQTTDVRLASAGVLPPCSVGCVSLNLVNQQVTIADDAWADPVPGYRIFKQAFSYPTSLATWYVLLTALDAGSNVNVYLLASDGTTILDFEYNLNTGSQVIMSIPPGGGSYFLGVAAFQADGLPRTFSIETGCTAAPPVISSLGSGVVFDGDTLQINGNYFGAVQGGSTVTINGTTATPSLWSETLIQVTVPVGATTGSVVVTVGGVDSNGFCVAALSSAIQTLDYEVTAYNPADFDLSGCTTFASGDPAWDGSFVYFDSAGPYWVSFDWNMAYPSSTTLNGKLLGDCDIICLGCSGGVNLWELTIWVSDDAIGTNLQIAWIGQKSGGADLAGVYTKTAGCSPGPATLTLNQI